MRALMSDFVESLLNSYGSVAAALLALSGAVFLLYALTIVILIGWQKVRGR
jgi:hypothetical protein